MTAAGLVRLVRLPLVVTAVFDPVAGLYLAGGGPLPLFLGVAAASALLYLGGMALNDLFDVGFDRVHHPDRVLPSARVRPGRALTLGATLLMAGVACAAFVRPACGMAALAVAVLVLLYDAGVKRVPVLGSLVMGACRGGSLVIGGFAATATGAAPPTAVWLAAGALAAYVAAVTSVSRLEEMGGGVARSMVRRRFLAGIVCLAAIPGLAASHPVAAAAPLGLLALSLLAMDARSARPLDRGEVMSRVGAGVRAILLVDAAVLWGAGGFAPGAGALGFFLLVTGWSRARARARNR